MVDKSFWKGKGAEMSAATVEAMFPVTKEARITTMDRPLIIESACPGWQVGGERFPAVPISIEDQVREISESVKAGAICVHIHPRDPDTGLSQINPALLKVVMDGVFDSVGDCVTLNHSWWPTPNDDIDYVRDTQELLEMGHGNKYIQGSVVLPVGWSYGQSKTIFGDEGTAKGLEYLENNRIKPIYQLYDTYSHWHFKHLLDEGHSTWKPYVMNLHLGKHSSHAIHQDPESYLNLIANVEMVKKTIPDSIIGIYPGGRNWLPILTLGILMGAELIRVGVEDCYWMWPHRDELIKKNSDTVKIAIELANIFGRKVVTDPKEARRILGMELTSKI
ncbi:3-keto-5-aminohexanoate cleavage protein [Chloroflexota bacterium]